MVNWTAAAVAANIAEARNVFEENIMKLSVRVEAGRVLAWLHTVVVSKSSERCAVPFFRRGRHRVVVPWDFTHDVVVKM